MGGGIPLRYVRKKSRSELNGGRSPAFSDLHTDLIVSKTKVKNSQNDVQRLHVY